MTCPTAQQQQMGPCTAMTNLSHGPALLQAQRFGIEISFVAQTVDTDTHSYRRTEHKLNPTYQCYCVGDRYCYYIQRYCYYIHRYCIMYIHIL